METRSSRSHMHGRFPRDALHSLETFGLWFRAYLSRIIFWTGEILIAFAVLGFLVVPLAVKPVLESQLSAALNRNVNIGRLDINPFALSATLHDVSISEHGQGPPVLTLAELYVNGEMASLFRWAPVISELKLKQPALNLVRNADKTYNFSDLLDQALAGPSGPPPRFSVSNIEVIDGRIDFDDRPEHRQHQVRAITIGIPFLSSLPTQTEIKVEPRFSAMVNGRGSRGSPSSDLRRLCACAATCQDRIGATRRQTRLHLRRPWQRSAATHARGSIPARRSRSESAFRRQGVARAVAYARHRSARRLRQQRRSWLD
ncbi:MAG: DUF748 domain-containing protein [Betaproteobacteria bacterium]|nr:MAG: DUF748 domain-containing protein [Betaproteobacteria bacterium]